MDQRASTGRTRRRRRGQVPRLAGVAFLGLTVTIALSVVSLVAGCAPQVVTSTSQAPSSSTFSSVGEPTPSAARGGTEEGRVEEATTITEASPPVIKIGGLFPLTGDLAAKGESALRGMRLAAEEVNAEGGIESLGGALLTLVEADTKGETDTARKEVARLAETEGVVAVVGTGQSTVAMEATDASERLELPFVVSSGAADEITDRNLAYTFRLCPKADWYARDQVAFLLALKNLAGLEVKAVALLHEDGEYGKRTAESQQAYLAQAGIEVVKNIAYSPEQADVHNEMLAIKQAGAQAVLTATLLGDATLIAKSAAVLHMKVPIIDAAGGVLDHDFMAEAGEAAESLFSVAEYVEGLSSSQPLEERVKEADGGLDADMLYGYQAVWVLARALERAKSIEGPRLRGALRTTALYGKHLVLPQSLLTFDGTGQNRAARLIVVQVQDGRLVAVWPTEYAQRAVRL